MRYYLILILVAFGGNSYTQNLFQDAVLLSLPHYQHERSNAIRNLSQDALEKIILHLDQDSLTVAGDTILFAGDVILIDDIFAIIAKDNPFFTTSNLEAADKIVLGSQYNNAGLANITASGDLTSSPFSITKISDGFARFLVTRTKEELSATFFRRFYRQLERQEELQILFPATFETLKTAEAEIYVYKRYLESLRYSFIGDLTLLPTQLQYYLQKTPLTNNQTAQTTLLDVLQITQYLLNEKTGEGLQKRGFWEYINYLADSSFIHRAVQTDLTSNVDLKIIAGHLQLSQLIAKSLWNQQDSTWEESADVFRHLSNPLTLKIYLGLLYVQGKNYTIGKKKDGTSLTFGELLHSSKHDLNQLLFLKAEIQRFVENGHQFDTALRDFRNKPDTTTNLYPLLYPMLESMFNMFEVGYNLGEIKPAGKDAKDKVESLVSQTFFRLLRQLNEFNLHISQRRYAAGVTNMLGILEEVGKVKGVDNSKLVKEVFRYGYFVAAVAEAENSEDVSKAIELFALPTGSGNQKKYSPFSITLNAYSGLTYGREYLVGLEDSGSGYIDSLERGILAVSAPIGIGFNYGMRKAGSISIYATAVDIGALTAYRFNDPVSEDLPVFKWENIVAPGLYLVYGLPWDIPISLGAGFQSGPQLRRLDSSFSIREAKARRFGIFLSADIPIVQFYSR